MLLPKHLSVSFADSSPQGEPPLEGRWHGVSRDGEVLAHFPGAYCWNSASACSSFCSAFFSILET